MRWVKRGCWAAAWGCWVWLGFGLHRELPRDLGPVVCKLPLEPNERAIGFIEGSKLATFRFNGATESSVVRRWDARSGSLEIEIGGAPFDQGPNCFDLSPDSRFLAWGTDTTHRQDWRSAFVTSRKGGFTPTDVGREMFDLLHGKRTAIPDHAGVEFHRTKPWVAYWLRGDEPAQYVRIVDLEADRIIAEWRGDRLADRQLVLGPWFVGSDRIAIPVRRAHPGVPTQDQPRFVEVWPINDGARPLCIIPGGPAFGPSMAESSNRIAWYETKDGVDLIHVADIAAGRVVFTEPVPETKRVWSNGEPALSDDGRSVLSAATTKLFDVDTARLLWAAAADEHVSWNDGCQRFEVCEKWCIPYTSRVLLRSYAVHHLHDGRFLWRTWKPTLQLRGTDTDGELLIVGDEVNALPLRVNYPLLALCQTILALPLILPWAIVRWRRNRRLRLAGVRA